jgi:hypothetical protein
VVQLVDQQPQVGLGPLAVGDVDGGAPQPQRLALGREEGLALGADPALDAVVATDGAELDGVLGANSRIQRPLDQGLGGSRSSGCRRA